MIQAILLSLGVAMLAVRLVPVLQRFAQHLTAGGSVRLVVGAIPLLIVAWKAFGALSGNGTLLDLAIFVIAATVVGHLLGGPEPANRIALAIATSRQHPPLRSRSQSRISPNRPKWSPVLS